MTKRVKANGVLIWSDGTVEPKDGLSGHTYITQEHRFRLMLEEHGIAIYVQLPRVNIDGIVVER